MKGTLTPVRSAMPAEQDTPGWSTVAAGVARVVGVIVAAILATVLLAVLVGCSSPPPLSAACKQAIAAQDAYVAYAEGLGYPNVSLGQGFQITAKELDLVSAVVSACPKDTKIEVLPTA